MNLNYPNDGAESEQDDNTEESEIDLLEIHPPGLQGHLLRLVNQTDHLQEQLDLLLDEARASGGQIEIITRHLTDSHAFRLLDERMADLLVRMETQQEQLEEVARTATKLSRTQFKSNALNEAQEQRTGSALTTLQEIISRREQMREDRALDDQRRLSKERAQAKEELAADLLPVLDGIESAIENGRLLLERHRAQHKDHADMPKPESKPESKLEPIGFWKRLSYAVGSVSLPKKEIVIRTELIDDSDEALGAWLKGLELVRERFLALLAGEGIQPIPTEGQMFDPKLHVAMEAVSGLELVPGSIATVLRKGYRQGDRVLRYAEVTVAK